MFPGSAFNLTSWGYQDCMANEADGSYGSMLTKLLLRTLPACYPVGSAYVHFPFLVPDYLKSRMASSSLGNLSDKYAWTRPLPAPGCIVISTYKEVSHVMAERHTYASEYNDRLRNLTKETLMGRELVWRIIQFNGCSVYEFYLGEPCPDQ